VYINRGIIFGADYAVLGGVDALTMRFDVRRSSRKHLLQVARDLRMMLIRTPPAKHAELFDGSEIAV